MSRHEIIERTAHRLRYLDQQIGDARVNIAEAGAIARRSNDPADSNPRVQKTIDILVEHMKTMDKISADLIALSTSNYGENVVAFAKSGGPSNEKA
jgi:hypothetical protein